MNLSAFDNLSDPQIQVLAYLAYYHTPLSKDNLRILIGSVSKSTSNKTEEILKELLKMEFIAKYKAQHFWDYETYYILPKWGFKVLYKVIKEEKTWLQKIKTTNKRFRGDANICNKVLEVIDAIVDGKCNTQLTSKDAVDRLITYLKPLTDGPEFQEIIPFLPASVTSLLIKDDLEFMIANDYGSEIERVLPLLQSLPPSDSKIQTVFHLYQLAYFIQNGTEDIRFTLTGHSPYICLLDALKSIRDGQYKEAVSQFNKARNLSLPAGLHFGSNVPQWTDYPIVNLLMIIAMIKSQDDSILADVTKICKQHLVTTYTKGLPAEIVATIYASDSVIDLTPYITCLLENVNESGYIIQKIAKMLCIWQSITPAQIKRENSKVKYDPNDIHYNAYITRLTDDLLTTIQVKPLWQKAIEQIISEEKRRTSRSTFIEDTNRNTRYAYFCTYSFGTIEIREQSRLKSGRWSSGRHVSESNFIYLSGDDLDEFDLKMKEVYKAHKYSSVKLNEVIHILKGSRKLYLGNNAPYINCGIQEGKPFLSTSIGKDHISISSNVPVLDKLGYLDDDIIYSFKDTTPNAVLNTKSSNIEREGIISYFKLPKHIKNYFVTLLKVGRFPLEAEPQLRAMLDYLKGSIEIHSEMVEGGSNLPQVEGNSDIIIQAFPNAGGYQVQAIVRPLSGGTLTATPGLGDNNLFDQNDKGERYQVVRNKKQEKTNAAPLAEFMEQLDLTEVSRYNWKIDPYSLLELMEWIPDQGDDFVLEWPEGQNIKLNVPNTQSWNVSLREKGDWFEVEGEIPIDQDTVLTIGQLLELMGESRGRFIRLENGQYIRLTDSLRRQLRRLDSVAQTVRGKTCISSFGAGLIADYLDGEITIDHPQKIEDMRQRIKSSQERQADIPNQLNATLRDYQEEGFRWLDRLTSWGAGACLADDMGLGKTIQTITFLLHKQTDGASMVVAPASVISNWGKELARFAPSLNVAILNDLSIDDRKEAIQQAAAGDIVLTTYGLLISEEESITSKDWNVVALDEAHSIKNASTKTSAVCMKIGAQHRIILTGTPIQNHLGELWNLFQFINPGLLGSFEQFSHKYIMPIEGAQDKDRQQQLKRIVQPFMLRRTKQEVVKELPDKQEITLPVQLSKEEMAIYELIRLEAKAQLEADAEGSGAASVNSLAMITKLRMASCAASLAHKKWSGPSSKINAFCDLISEICTTGNHVLVFSQFTSFLEMAQNELIRHDIKDFLYLDGSTPLKRRTQMVEQFQKGEVSVFLISLKAGGLGLNLTNANYVIHLDPWWNPAIEQQATDRAYRIGQQQKVTVYHLISQHTIEEKIVRLHQTKRDMADSLLEGTDMSHKLNATDLLNMLIEAE